MTKYRVFYNTTATVNIEVEADNREQAEHLADQLVFVNLCHQCAHDVDMSDDFEHAETIEVEA